MAAYGLSLTFDRSFRASGPGDTLRFVHALRYYLAGHQQESVRVFTAFESLRRVNGLVSDAESAVRERNIWRELDDPPVVWTASGVVDTLARLRGSETYDGRLFGLLGDVAKTFPFASLDVLVHPYVGGGMANGPATMSIGGADIIRFRVDTLKRMRGERWRIPASVIRSADARNVAVLLRLLGHRMDTPDSLVTIVRQLAVELGISLLFYGDEEAFRRFDIPVAERRNYEGKSFLQQMQSYANECVAALGVNSGGLDLATAAGLPTLRICEYQDGGYWFEGKELGNQGRPYNLFLANSFVIGLQPPYDMDEWWNDAHLHRVRSSIRSFFDLVRTRDARLAEPKHMLLPRARELAVDDLDAQLAAFEVTA